MEDDVCPTSKEMLGFLSPKKIVFGIYENLLVQMKVS
jgi:hypothetical protein